MPLFSSAPQATSRRRKAPAERSEDKKLDVLQELGLKSEDDKADEKTPEASEPKSAAEETGGAMLLFQPPEITRPAPRKSEPIDNIDDEDDADDEDTSEVEEDSGRESSSKSRRRRGGRGGRGRKNTDDKDSGNDKSDKSDKNEPAESDDHDEDESSDDQADGSSRRTRRRRRRDAGERARAEVTPLKGSTRLEAKRQRRKEGREAGRRRQVITEAEFLARRESVDRIMVVREKDGLNQIAVLEDDILVEHYVARRTQTSMVGNVYLGRVQNVLSSMEAAFVDLGKGRNAVLYAGEVNWDAVNLDGQPRRIEQALSSGDSVLVQVTKDPIGQKGARLTSQVTLAGRYLVLVPSGAMTGISRKLPESERTRLKRLLKDIVPDGSGVIVRTAAEGATEEQLRADVERLTSIWKDIDKKAKKAKSAPVLLKGEPELAVRVVRDVFNEDFAKLVISGEEAFSTVTKYVKDMSPDLADRIEKWDGEDDVFAHFRIDEQLSKGMDNKVWLPSGGSLVIDRTEAMTVIDVNTGRFTGKGGTLEETVTKNNIEAAEEIVRQLRLRDIGGIIVIDFIDMVLESNRDLVLRRLIECLGRDRTRHQVAEVTSLGLVQMTRKRVGQGLVEAFSEPCEHCSGRGFIVHDEPVEKDGGDEQRSSRSRRKKQLSASQPKKEQAPAELPDDDEAAAQAREAVKATLATIAAAAAGSHAKEEEHKPEKPAKQAKKVAEPEPSKSAEPAAPRGSRKRRRATSSSTASESVSEPVTIEAAPTIAVGSATVVASGTASKPKRRSRRATSSTTAPDVPNPTEN
ncbi:hypothetical protein BSZ39_02995 [Bowdeniella nasicola]|uniref:Ribonuclease E n=1 Tax=Bowdeniella nasicola TaxID=208480 RepID=A0A1Q5Q4C5_9ACTO|nr:hypothetical protein BSZ39_02995 [Bowdeniella nasicola]